MARSTDYHRAITLLRYYFGERAFPASRGYGLRTQTPAARRWIRRHRQLIHAMVAINAYPKKVLAGRVAARAQAVAPEKLQVIRDGRRKTLPWKHLPVMVASSKARVTVRATAEGDQVRVREGKRVRWYYPLSGVERAEFAENPFEFLGEVMRRERAAFVSFQLWGNVVDEAYSRADIAEGDRGLFGALLADSAGDVERAENFFGGMSGLWFFNRGNSSADWGPDLEEARRERRREIDAARDAWRRERKALRQRAKRPSRRALLTGRV